MRHTMTEKPTIDNHSMITTALVDISIALCKMRSLVSGSRRSRLVRFRFGVGVRTFTLHVFPFFFVNTTHRLRVLDGCLVSSHGFCYFCVHVPCALVLTWPSFYLIISYLSLPSSFASLCILPVFSVFALPHPIRSCRRMFVCF